MSASTKCKHSEFDFNFEIAAFEDTNIRYLEIIGTCKFCKTPIEFQGQFPIGLDPGQPTQVELGNTNLVLPFIMDGEIYDGKSAGYILNTPKFER